jgi:hypothetical protein
MELSSLGVHFAALAVLATASSVFVFMREDPFTGHEVGLVCCEGSAAGGIAGQTANGGKPKVELRRHGRDQHPSETVAITKLNSDKWDVTPGAVVWSS